MNIFDKKLNEEPEQSLPISPIELYQTCPYNENYGYLRGIQEEVLTKWHNNRHQRDIICKMNTGSGKTLTGLLMLYSKLIEKVGPCLYACPDLQLLDQTVTLAGLYGIPVCVFDNSKPNIIPPEFLNSKSILVTSFQKLFNGKSIFTKEHISIGAILLDDAHKCVDIAREQTTLKFSRSHTISKRLFTLFSDSLKHQLPGSFRHLQDGDPSMHMKLPYWAWIDSNEKVIDIINEYLLEIKDKPEIKEDSLKISWNIIADNLLSYDCYFSGRDLEISPIHVPYHEIPSFNEAKFRFILSATFEDDYDLIKDLGISYGSIANPIIPVDRKDVGKRLILAPSRYDTSLKDSEIRNFISNYKDEKYNVVVLVPSGPKAAPWEKLGALLVDRTNISDAIDKLQNSLGNFMVFVNRYDGIDLHNDLCRVLVIDGLPMYSSLNEYYAEVRIDSVRSGKKAQIIEQGLGRATRSGGDYSLIFLMGDDLMSFMGLESNLSHFTPVTKSQIDMGLNLLDGEESTDSLSLIKKTALLGLENNKSWHTYHSRELLKSSNSGIDERKQKKLEIAEIERKAIEQFRRRRYDDASEIILNEIVNKQTISEKEKAWYYQFAAQLLHKANPVNSNNLQIKACSLTTKMFHPIHEHFYKKISTKGVQVAEVIKRLGLFTRPQDIMNHVEGMLNELQYNPEIDAKNFEKRLAELGDFLGFSSQMPEKDMGNGPDVLWCLVDGHYLILEAKSRANHAEITRQNIGQLDQSETWFKIQYPGRSYTAVTLQKTNVKGGNVNINEFTKVLDQESLDKLRYNLRQFANSLQATETNGYTDDQIGKLLIAHNFTSDLFRKTYLKKIK